jgi:hypothetical protein
MKLRLNGLRVNTYINFESTINYRIIGYRSASLWSIIWPHKKSKSKKLDLVAGEHRFTFVDKIEKRGRLLF